MVKYALEINSLKILKLLSFLIHSTRLGLIFMISKHSIRVKKEKKEFPYFDKTNPCIEPFSTYNMT